MKTTKANKKVLVILAAMAAISSTAFGAGVNNTVDPNATLYGAEVMAKIMSSQQLAHQPSQ